MFIKLGIIAGIVILGGMIFSNEIDRFFPTTSANIVDSLKDDVMNLSSQATDSVEKRIDESIDKIVDKTSNTLQNEIMEAGDKITSEISEVKESSQQIISDEIMEAGDKITSEISEVKESSQQIISNDIPNFNPVEYIQNLFSENSK